ncbi:MAG: acyl-CoA thioesterase, partial [Acidimicrobiales bacterium]
LEPTGLASFRSADVADPSATGTVFGGRMLAQMLLASTLAAGGSPEHPGSEHPGSEHPGSGHPGSGDGKAVASIQTVFVRAAPSARPLEIDVEALHAGRTVAAQTLTVRQGDRCCARALVLRQSDHPDVIRHTAAPPSIDGPDEAVPATFAGLVPAGTEVRVVGGVDTWDPQAPTGPPELFVWLRLPALALGDLPPAAVAQALLAFASDGFLIGAAMRPHAGIGQDMAHRSLSTGVLAHNLTFHEQVPTGAWLRMAQESTYAGRGRAQGRGQVFTDDGALVASFGQDSIIRDDSRSQT